MKTIALALLAAGCWLAAREAAWGQSALERLEDMIRQQKPAPGVPKPPVPAPPPGTASVPAGESREPGYLGVLADDKDDRGRGVRILKVTPGGPADRAGLKVQDLITRLGGVPVRQMSELTAILQQMSVGATLPFEILRGDQKLEVPVVFGRRPPDQQSKSPKEPRGEAPPLSAAGPPPAAPALEVPPGEGPVIPGASPAQPAKAAADAVSREEVARLLRRIEQLEKRVEELERKSPEKK